MTEPDFRGGADRNPQLFGVNLDCKPTLEADLSSETGRGRKSGGAYAPSAPPRWAPLIILILEMTALLNQKLQLTSTKKSNIKFFIILNFAIAVLHYEFKIKIYQLKEHSLKLME